MKTTIILLISNIMLISSMSAQCDFQVEIDTNQLIPYIYSLEAITTGNDEGVNYVWEFGDGAFANFNDSLSHEYASTGLFTVVLDAFKIDTNVFPNDTCHAYDTVMLNILESDDPTCSFTAGATVIKNNLAVDFEVNTVGVMGSVFYSWDFGDGNSSNQGPDVSHVYGTPGIYNFSVFVEDAVVGNICLYLVRGTIEVFEDETTSIKEVDRFNLEMYPNPTNGIINLLSENVIKRMSLHSLDGKLKYQEIINSKNKSIDVSRMVPKGMYVIHLYDNANQSVSKKIVIE